MVSTSRATGSLSLAQIGEVDLLSAPFRLPLPIAEGKGNELEYLLAGMLQSRQNSVVLIGDPDVATIPVQANVREGAAERLDPSFGLLHLLEAGARLPKGPDRPHDEDVGD